MQDVRAVQHTNHAALAHHRHFLHMMIHQDLADMSHRVVDIHADNLGGSDMRDWRIEKLFQPLRKASRIVLNNGSIETGELQLLVGKHTQHVAVRIHVHRAAYQLPHKLLEYSQFSLLISACRKLFHTQKHPHCRYFFY